MQLIVIQYYTIHRRFTQQNLLTSQASFMHIYSATNPYEMRRFPFLALIASVPARPASQGVKDKASARDYCPLENVPERLTVLVWIGLNNCENEN
jgi:hypothetical protein